MNLDELEQSLAAVPTSELSPESRERIGSRIRNRTIELGEPSLIGRTLTGRVAYAGALAAVLIAVVLFVLTTPPSSVQLDPIENPGQTATALPSTATLNPTNLSIEGPVSAIDANIMTIYGITIAIPPDSTMLSSIEIGDTLYIEGIANPDASQSAKFVATRVEQVSR